MKHTSTAYTADVAPSAEMATLQLIDLTTGYRSRHATHVVASHLNASLHSGRLTCLLGPNGAGKSTILRTMAAFQPPLSGHINLGTRRLDSFTPRELATRIGIVLTERPDMKGMTVTDLVSMGRSPYTGFWGKLSANDQTQVREAIRLVGIEPLSQRSVNTLSDGERQKVMIAKSLVQECPLVILDEPTAFLDVASRIEITQLLHDIAHIQNKTVLLSTHDIEQALQLSDQLWLLTKDGLQTGSPEDLVANHKIDTLFEGRNVVFDEKTWTFRSKTRLEFF